MIGRVWAAMCSEVTQDVKNACMRLVRVDQQVNEHRQLELMTNHVEAGEGRIIRFL